MKAHLVAVDDCAGRLKKLRKTTTSVAEGVPAHVTKRRELHHFASTPRMRSMNKSRSERLKKARTPSSFDSFRQCAADRDGHLTFFRKLIQNWMSRWHAKGKPSCGINKTIVRRMCCHEKLCGRVRSEVCRSLSHVEWWNTISRHLTLAVLPGQTLSRRACNRNRLLAEKCKCSCLFEPLVWSAEKVDQCPGLPQSFATLMRKFCGSAEGPFLLALNRRCVQF